MNSYFLTCHHKPFISQNLAKKFDEIIFIVAKHKSLRIMTNRSEHANLVNIED
jgi:predicted ATP-binding protein involved in virulence